jgi:hypothetical protein
VAYLREGCHYEVWSTAPGSQVAHRVLSRYVTAFDYALADSETTTANLTFQKASGSAASSCCEAFRALMAGEHEILITRGGFPVWHGPIARVTERRSTVKVKAYDRSVWWQKWRTIPSTFSEVTEDLGAMWLRMAGLALGVHPAGVTLPAAPLVGINATRSVTAGAAEAGKDIDEVSRTGMPWTIVGDTIILGRPTGYTVARLTDEDFVEDLALVQDAEAWGSRVWMNGDAGIQATAGGANSRGVLKDVVVSDRQITDLTSAQAAADRRQANLGGDAPPIVLEMPDGDGATLAPTAGLAFSQLVPGRTFAVRLSNAYCRAGFPTERYTLTDVKVSCSGLSQESVKVTLVPEQTR